MATVIIIFLAILAYAVLCLFGFTLLLYPFANYIKPVQKFYCKIGWHCHPRDYIFDYNDGASDHCTCKWCGYKGRVDSQGNLI